MLLFFSLMISMNSCKTEEVATPAAATVSADRLTTNLATPVTFTISEVSASAVTLFPYGTENAYLGSVAVTFTNGSAVIPFSYSKVGTWNAVVVTNNNSIDPRGKVSVKNTPSQILSIKVGNNRAKFSKFNIAKSTSRKVSLDTANKVVYDTIPWDPSANAFQVTATFAADAFSKVFVGSTIQASDTTKNDFSSTVTYTVKSQDGLHSTDYPVHIYRIPAATDNKIKSVSGIATSKKAAGLTVVGVVDNANKIAVLYQPFGLPTEYNDSIKFHYVLNNGFAVMKYGGKVLKQDSTLNLLSAKTVTVYAQDSTTADYKLYSGISPKLSLYLDPPVSVTDVATAGFNISFTVAKGTDVTALNTTSIVSPVANVTVNSTTVTVGSATTPFVSGMAIDYSKPVKFTLNVTDTNIVPTGITYDVVYTVSVTVLK